MHQGTNSVCLVGCHSVHNQAPFSIGNNYAALSNDMHTSFNAAPLGNVLWLHLLSRGGLWAGLAAQIARDTTN